MNASHQLKIDRALVIVVGLVFSSNAFGAKGADEDSLNPPPGQLQRPNILLILADDLGWSDVGCYGNRRFDTPNLDRLAQEGMLFTQAYAAAPICSASRASLLTGNSTARNGFEFVVKEAPGRQNVPARLLAPPFTIDLALDSVTIAEMLAQRGYRTGFFGKWHLNAHHGRYLGWSPTLGHAVRREFASRQI